MNSIEIEMQEGNLSLCDKCGKPVEKSNCALEFSYRLQPEAIMASYITMQRRHLLPMQDEDGNRVCEGSPSRVRLLENSSDLTQREKSFVEKAKVAFQQMNEKFGPPNTVI